MSPEITREQAIYVLFCEEINKDNITKFIKWVNNMEDIEVCYEKDPLQLILISLKMINTSISISKI